MKNTELLRSALQSLRANPKRSFLTTIGITIGIAAVITILALGNGVKKRISDECFGFSIKIKIRNGYIYRRIFMGNDAMQDINDDGKYQ